MSSGTSKPVGAIVDWLTFTVPVKKVQPDVEKRLSHFRALGQMTGDDYAVEAFRLLEIELVKAMNANYFEFAKLMNRLDVSLDRSKGRRHQNIGMESELGFHAFGNAKMDYASFEATGRGCGNLRAIAPDWINSFRGKEEKITRIDIAVDIITDTTPREFAHKVGSNRAAYGAQDSVTGSTVYLGSKKSDRYVRVYRYNPPHPRSDKLRIEMVFRRKQCLSMMGSIFEHGLWEAALMAGQIYKFQHKDWTSLEGFDPDKEKVKAMPVEQRGQNTLMWFIRQVLPAIERMEKEGIISRKDLVNQYILPSDKKAPPKGQ